MSRDEPDTFATLTGPKRQRLLLLSGALRPAQKFVPRLPVHFINDKPQAIDRKQCPHKLYQTRCTTQTYFGAITTMRTRTTSQNVQPLSWANTSHGTVCSRTYHARFSSY